MVRQQFLRQRFVACQEQPARIAARIRQFEQLEMTDDVLVEDRHVVESFEKIEGDVRLPLCGSAADIAEVIVDAETCTSWPFVRSVVITSYSVRHGAERMSVPSGTTSGGTR